MSAAVVLDPGAFTMAKNIPTFVGLASLLALAGCQSKGLWTVEARNSHAEAVQVVVEWPSDITPGARIREEANVPGGASRLVPVWFREPPERFRVAVKGPGEREVVKMFVPSDLPAEQRAPSSMGRTLRLEIGDELRFRSPNTLEKLQDAGPAMASLVFFAGAAGVLWLYIISIRRNRPRAATKADKDPGSLR